MQQWIEHKLTPSGRKLLVMKKSKWPGFPGHLLAKNGLSKFSAARKADGQGEAATRKKPAPGWIGTLAVKFVVEEPLFAQVGLWRSFLNCTWKGGCPPVQLRTTFGPACVMLTMRGGVGIVWNDLIAFGLERSLMRILVLEARSTENSSQLADPPPSK